MIGEQRSCELDRSRSNQVMWLKTRRCGWTFIFIVAHTNGSQETFDPESDAANVGADAPIFLVALARRRLLNTVFFSCFAVKWLTVLRRFVLISTIRTGFICHTHFLNVFSYDFHDCFKATLSREAEEKMCLQPSSAWNVSDAGKVNLFIPTMPLRVAKTMPGAHLNHQVHPEQVKTVALQCRDHYISADWTGEGAVGWIWLD